MAFNGSGTFNLPTGNPVVVNTTIDAAVHNNTNNEIATALSNCVTRDGQSPPTGSLPMAGFKLTGLGAGTGNGESVRYEQTTKQTSDTGASIIATGTTAQAPTGSAGYFRFNSTLNKFVGWINGGWAAIGGGSTGGGVDELFVEMDAVMTTSFTIGSSSYADGVIFAVGADPVISMAGHNFVVDSLIHFRAGSGGTLPAAVVYDTVYRVTSVVAGVSFKVVTNSTGATITTATAGTAPNQVGKIKHSLIPNPFVQAAGTVLTVESGTVLTQA